MTLAEMLDKLERGRIGHAEAMRWLGTESLNELVAKMHANGRQMPGHRPMQLSAETREILRLTIRKPDGLPPAPGANHRVIPAAVNANTSGRKS